MQIVYEEKLNFQSLSKMAEYESLMNSFKYIALAVATCIIFSFMNVAIHQDE